MNANKKAYYEAQNLRPPKRRASRRAAPRGSAFLRTVFLRSPSSGKRMRIQDVTGAETLLDHLQIICGNKSERYLFKVYISEMPNKEVSLER